MFIYFFNYSLVQFYFILFQVYDAVVKQPCTLQSAPPIFPVPPTPGPYRVMPTLLTLLPCAVLYVPGTVLSLPGCTS